MTTSDIFRTLLKRLRSYGLSGNLAALSDVSDLPSGEFIGATISPSNDATGATDPANLAAALASSNSVTLLPGTYYGNTTAQVGLGQYVYGPGHNAATWRSVVSTAIPAFQQVNTGAYSGTQNSAITGFTIDGSGAAAGAIGVQAGDIVRLKHDLNITGFNGAGSIGAYLINANYWTEQGEFKYFINNCSTGVKCDQSGAGTNSFDRCRFDVTFNQTVNQAGFVVAGATAGINLLECDLRLVGNWAGSSASTGVVLSLAASNAKILTSRMFIGIEIDGGTVGPQSVNFSGASNIIQDCFGMLEFYGSSWQASNNNFQVDFRGTILGDDTLLVKPKGSQNDASVNSGWPAGISGTVTWKYAWENTLVFVSFNISVSAVALTAGETLLSGLAAKLRSSSSKKFAVDCNGTSNFLQIDSSGNLKSVYAVSSGTYTIEGTGVYSNAL